MLHTQWSAEAWLIVRARSGAGALVAERDSLRTTLLADLEAFVRDHRSHGGMTGDAKEPATNGCGVSRLVAFQLLAMVASDYAILAVQSASRSPKRDEHQARGALLSPAIVLQSFDGPFVR